MRKCDLDRDWWQSSCLALRGHVRRGNEGRGGCQNRASRRAPAKGRAVRRCQRSPAVALATLAFLVIIHKLEYFVNARKSLGLGASLGHACDGGMVGGPGTYRCADVLRLYQRRANDAEVDLRSDLGPDRNGRGIAFDRTTDEHQTHAELCSRAARGRYRLAANRKNAVVSVRFDS